MMFATMTAALTTSVTSFITSVSSFITSVTSFITSVTSSFVSEDKGNQQQNGEDYTLHILERTEHLTVDISADL